MDINHCVFLCFFFMHYQHSCIFMSCHCHQWAIQITLMEQKRVMHVNASHRCEKAPCKTLNNETMYILQNGLKHIRVDGQYVLLTPKKNATMKSVRTSYLANGKSLSSQNETKQIININYTCNHSNFLFLKYKYIYIFLNSYI